MRENTVSVSLQSLQRQMDCGSQENADFQVFRCLKKENLSVYETERQWKERHDSKAQISPKMFSWKRKALQKKQSEVEFIFTGCL